MRELTHLSLFTGFGGLDLAAEWAGIKTVGQVEWEDYPTKVLTKHWPDVPRWRDIRTLTGENFYERTNRRTVDIISGGFPCQPFSVAGKQRGKEDDRYLWPEMARIIKELRPNWVIGENVAGIVRMELTEILSELEGCGYSTRTFLIPACGVGARHKRNRVAIVGWNAYSGERNQWQERKMESWENTKSAGICTNVPNSHGERLQRFRAEGKQKFRTQPEEEESKRSGTICHTAGKRLSDGTGEPLGRQKTQKPKFKRPDCSTRERECTVKSGMGMLANGIPSGLGGCDLDFFLNHYWDAEPDIPRVATGVKNRVKKIKGFGNAAVPQQFYPVFKGIYKIEMGCACETIL